MGTAEFNRKQLKERQTHIKEQITGRKKVPSGKHRIPKAQRITTDDVIDAMKGIGLAIAASGIAVGALKKIGNAISRQKVVTNLEDLKKDAQEQIKKSLQLISLSIHRSKTTFSGKKRSRLYPKYEYPKKEGYKFKVSTGGEED